MFAMQAQGAINQAFYLYRIGTAMANLSWRLNQVRGRGKKLL